MTRIARMLVLSTALGATRLLAGPVLLASYSQVMDGATAPEADPRVEFVLQVNPNVPVPFSDAPSIGVGTFWTNALTGTLTFDAQNDPDFPGLAARLTDGVDDRFAALVHFAGGNEHGTIGEESEPLSTTPDLIGNVVQFIKLRVNDVEFTPITVGGFEGYRVHSDVIYDFYGTPVPECSSVWLLFAGSVTFLRKGAPYKPRLA